MQLFQQKDYSKESGEITYLLKFRMEILLKNIFILDKYEWVLF